MKIYGVVIGWQEEDNIERCLKSLKPVVDTLVYIDGAFKNFKHDKPYSTDNTIEIARQYADIVVTTNKAWETEIQKRNAYLIAEPDDFYINIDADEEFIGTLPTLTENAYLIDLYDDKPYYNTLVARVFKHQRGINYFRVHNWLWINGELVFDNKKEFPTLTTCHLRHHTERSQWRIEAKEYYYYEINIHNIKRVVNV
jgi:hypothetical protein